MFVLDWRLALLALAVLPLFLIGSKRVGRTLRAITRESMDLNAAMNTQMTERFGVAGALLVTLFGRQRDEEPGVLRRAARVRDIGVRTAMVSRTFLLGLEHRRRPRHGRRLLGRQPAGDQRRPAAGRPGGHGPAGRGSTTRSPP